MLSEKYRPNSWQDYVGHEKQTARIRAQLERGRSSGRFVFYISGPSGIGKTSLARLIAREFCADEMDIDHVNGDSCQVETVREFRRTFAQSTISGGKWRAIIIDEAHAMSPRAVQAWLPFLENLPANRIVIFTTTESPKDDTFGEFTDPFLSRCSAVALSAYGVKAAFAERARAIAQLENLDGQPLAKYERLVQDRKNNLRAVLSAIDSGEMLAS